MFHCQFRPPVIAYTEIQSKPKYGTDANGIRELLTFETEPPRTLSLFIRLHFFRD